ncbi:helix-turn-helix domain-containing protein [Kribbella sp. NPDC051587]|uniref:helix-turn-helix domain-containing protein n=1 Tax=Kribbella sp. NPDC051587 TaxID=3364119 RepID=UPI0037987C41
MRRASQEVSRLLRTGPFEAALDSAITANGMSLEDLRLRLAAKGVTVSRTALSYWRRGRSRPERGESLEAVARIEEILELPPTSLLALLGARRPRGRWIDHPPGTLARWKLWPSSEPLLKALDAPPDGQLAFLHTSDLLVVNEGPGARRQRVRLVAEARAERVDRCLVYHEMDDPQHLVPELTGVTFGRRGRVRCDLENRQFVAEFLFDRPLETGEHAVIEYELMLPVSQPMDNFYRHFTRPGGLYTLQLRFPGRRPAWVRRYDRATPSSPERHIHDLWLSEAGTTALAVPDVRPGTVGVRWVW